MAENHELSLIRRSPLAGDASVLTDGNGKGIARERAPTRSGIILRLKETHDVRLLP